MVNKARCGKGQKWQSVNYDEYEKWKYFLSDVQTAVNKLKEHPNNSFNSGAK